MHCQMELSKVTTQYVSRFYDLLNEMRRKMTNAGCTDSISHNFIVQMLPHHQTAIYMSHNLLQYTTWIPLQNLAENIIREQTKSIEDMTKILNRCCLYTNTEQDLSSYLQCFDSISQTMFTRMENACTDNSISGNFLREMIPHHEGAIQMSENALHFPVCEDLLPILSSMITCQRAGIQKMKSLERTLYTCHLC